MAFTVGIILLKFSKRLSAALRKASFTMSPSSNGFLCFSKDETDVMGSSSCGLTLGFRLGEY